MEDDHTGSFIWYELMTTDIDAAKAFYDAVVGWRVDAQPSGDSDMDYRMIVRSDGGLAGGMLQLTPEMTDGGARPAWYGYVHVADVDAAVKRFEDAGGTPWMPARDMPGVGRMALVSDAEGAPIYVMTPVPPEDDPEATSDVFSPDAAEHVRWNELSTTDQDGAIAFYTDLFGWSQDGAMPMGELGDYKFLARQGTMIGAVMPKPPAMPQPAWTYSIGVRAIDAALAAVEDGGGTVAHGPDQIPGGEFSAVCVDPQGAVFGLVGPRKDQA